MIASNNRFGESTDAGQFAILPPHSIENEMCMLGGMMIGNDPALIETVRGIVRKDQFFQADHAIIFEVLCNLIDTGRPIDPMLVREELSKRNLLEDVGDIPYISQLITCVPSAVHTAHYAEIVRQKAALRTMISLGNELIRKCNAPSTAVAPSTEIAGWLAEQITAVVASDTVDQIFTIGAVIEDVLENHENGVAERMLTGIDSLDQLTGGLPIGGLTIIAGRPGMGKSQALKQIVLKSALRGTKCGIVSIEESRMKIGRNMLSNQSGVNNSAIAFGKASAGDWKQIHATVPGLMKLPIFIADAPTTLSEVSAAITKLVVKFGCTVIAVDYLQLVNDDSGDSETREQQVAQISMGLKRLFKRFNVVGIAAAQLNRGNETQGVRRPELRDLRSSGQLEQDGDLVLLLHRNDYYASKQPHFIPTRVLEMIVAKNKDGGMGQVNVEFDGNTQSIRDFADPLRSNPGNAVDEVDDLGI